MPKIAKLRQHGSHVGMKIGPAIANSGIGEYKAGHLIFDERAENLPADLGRHARTSGKAPRPAHQTPTLGTSSSTISSNSSMVWQDVL